MSAPYYTTMPPPPRRHPLSTAANHYAVNQAPRHAPPAPGTPPKQQKEQPKQPSSPPLPRQNAKVTPPSPPSVIMDKTRDVALTRVGLLGEGGFARVYEVKDDTSGRRSACKVVTKSSLKNKKAKIKLYAEIRIHKSLDHPNIVRFEDCFEDEENVYMTLELCHNGSLMDMLRRRRRFTEPEARFFMVQLIGACQHMHDHQVIHRDLKLGNIFLDRNMNVKVGDFGLAALIETPGERKKTICGTPNYIAPEVLFDNVNGHSFEVDTWSIGVILYTLVIGRPPFQTKELKAIYKRIRENDYEFPADRAVSTLVKELVQCILTPNPAERPTLHEIVDHTWFTNGTVPGYIPVSAHDAPPDFRHIQPHMSQANLARLRRNALLDEDQVPAPSAPPPNANPTKGRSSSLAQQEKEFQKAVQPGSPISALLSSARQPFIVAQQANPTSMNDQPLLRKLQAAKEAMKSPARPGTRGLQGIAEEREDQYGARVEEMRKKELESQKARIVAQMVPAPGSAPGSVFGGDDQDQESENVPPARTRDHARLVKERERQREKERAQEMAPALERVVENRKERTVSGERAKEQGSDDVAMLPAGLAPRVNGFDAAAQTLSAAFEAKAIGRLFRDPRQDAGIQPPKVFIASWVDYCNKYGMGYALTDGSVGVHFNDSSSMVLSADKEHFDFIEPRHQGMVYVRKNYTVGEYPDEIHPKVYLLKHFEGYIMDRLTSDHEYQFEDVGRTRGMEFVQRYLRMKQVVVFKLSHDVLQFNFQDHSKLILSSHGLHITYIDKNYCLSRFTLSQVMADALRPPVQDPETARFKMKLVDKLKFAKEMLLSIKNASLMTQAEGQADKATSGGSSPAEAPAPAPAPAPVPAPTRTTVPTRAPAPVRTPAPAHGYGHGPAPPQAYARSNVGGLAPHREVPPSRLIPGLQHRGLAPARSTASLASKMSAGSRAPLR